MYESPIEIIQTEMQMQMDGEILKAVQGVGIDVNKEELIKALDYDREQYSKGYKDGVKESAEKVKNYVKTHCNPYGKPIFDYDTSLKILKYLDNLLAEMVGGKNA